MSYTALPKEHAKRIRTTNMMERINKELKRRTKVVRALLNPPLQVRACIDCLPKPRAGGATPRPPG
ncbi:hypothetical protein E2N92_02865 [Methanofollis formosanus]|uniref:Transposase n=1 Tax=Methanofollis formosanus TaxID=299308 RepID=A0A8G1A108_9EURY|nr:hypothetical protein E2N92_02865 [Methanofollis formosanus]